MGRTLALIGGGDTHIELLHQLAKRPLSDIDVALFDPLPSVWYSRMAPGVIAGHIEASEAKINLWALCQRARVRFFETSVTRIDAGNQRIYTALGERHFYDFLSLDIGSATAPLPQKEGAYLVPVKPTQGLCDMVEERSLLMGSQARVVVVGGGPVAVEMALALAFRWRDREPPLTILTRSPLLEGLPKAARRAALAACARYRVRCFEGQHVAGIAPGRVLLATGEALSAHIVILATRRVGPALLASSGLELARDGTVATHPSLQSVSHPNVFAVGGCATVEGRLRYQADDSAEAEALALLAALEATARGETPAAWTPRPPSLRWITLGDQRAIATGGGLSLTGHWVWRWKNTRDRRKIRRYTV